MAGIDKIYGTQEQYLELEKWLDDLGWEEQRMSSSGVETYNKLVNYLENL